MTDLQITTFVPQTSDNERMLLARLLAGMLLKAPIRGTLLASAARSVTTSSSLIDGTGFKGLWLWLNVTVASGTGGLSVYVEHQDPVSGNWAVTAVQSYAVITTLGLRPFLLAEGLGLGSNMGAAGAPPFADRGHMLSSAIRIRVVHNDASGYTYSLGYELIP